MTTQDAFSLKRYMPVQHKHFGECIVLEIVPEFGPIILPITTDGIFKLCNASGMLPGVPYLASDYKQNLKKML